MFEPEGPWHVATEATESNRTHLPLSCSVNSHSCMRILFFSSPKMFESNASEEEITLVSPAQLIL